MVHTKKIYCQNVFVPDSFTEFITLQRLYNYVDLHEWYPLLIKCVMFQK